MESLNLLCVDMNALELADELENTYPFVGVMEVAVIMLRQQEVEIERITSKHEEMLRQQQAEIEALKAGKIRAYDNGVEDGRKPNTNLVKELTDEEIRHIQAICHLKDVGYDNFIMRFARAILRKAKEK